MSTWEDHRHWSWLSSAQSASFLYECHMNVTLILDFSHANWPGAGKEERGVLYHHAVREAPLGARCSTAGHGDPHPEEFVGGVLPNTGRADGPAKRARRVAAPFKRASEYRGGQGWEPIASPAHPAGQIYGHILSGMG